MREKQKRIRKTGQLEKARKTGQSEKAGEAEKTGESGAAETPAEAAKWMKKPREINSGYVLYEKSI